LEKIIKKHNFNLINKDSKLVYYDKKNSQYNYYDKIEGKVEEKLWELLKKQKNDVSLLELISNDKKYYNDDKLNIYLNLLQYDKNSLLSEISVKYFKEKDFNSDDDSDEEEKKYKGNINYYKNIKVF
jgi:hypothetical protein